MMKAKKEELKFAIGDEVVPNKSAKGLEEMAERHGVERVVGRVLDAHKGDVYDVAWNLVDTEGRPFVGTHTGRTLRPAITGWDITIALEFCRELEAVLVPTGHHLAMAGSVLIAGSSNNDLDILIYPHDTSQRGTELVAEAIVIWGMVMKFDALFVRRQWQKAGSLDEKCVEVWEAPAKYLHRRVDLFFVE